MNNMDKHMQEFAARVRARRSYLKLRAQDVALEVGVSANTYSHYEAGRRAPTLTVAVKIAAVLGSSLDELFGGVLNENACKD
jgi:transcriptional regulator with XRE-family HTH domain